MMFSLLKCSKVEAQPNYAFEPTPDCSAALARARRHRGAAQRGR
jgi:hypothetical protein